MASVERFIERNQSFIIMDKVKAFSKWHFIDALLLACVILLCLTLVLHISRCQWMDAVADAIWITIAIINVHRSARDTAMSKIITDQQEFIDTVHDIFNYARLKAQVDADNEVAEAMEEHFKEEEGKE